MQDGREESRDSSKSFWDYWWSRRECDAKLLGAHLATNPTWQTSEGKAHKTNTFNECMSKLHWPMLHYTKVNSSNTIWCLFSFQHNVKHVADPLIRRNIHHYPAELPKLNMVVPGPQISFPVSTMPAFTVTHRGSLPAITSKKCQSQLAKVNTAVLHRRQTFLNPWVV